MINNRLAELINDTLRNRKDRHGWDSGRFNNLLLLSIDQRGKIGERLIEAALRDAGVPGVVRSTEKNRTKKHWDIRTADMDIEVKTATLGRNTNSFQHESLERDRNYHALALLDIAPNDVYLTWQTKASIDWRALHRRANSNFYKMDLKLSALQGSKISSAADILAGYRATLKALKS